MVKKDVELVYICTHKANENIYWVLPHKNGMNVARIMTHLIEDVFRGTDWRVEAVNSLDSLDGKIQWIFSSKEDLYAFFENIE